MRFIFVNLLNFDKVILLQSDQSTRDDWLLRIEYHIDCNKKQCVTKWKDRNYCNLLVYNLTKKYQRAWFPRWTAVHPKGLLSRKHSRNRRRQFAYGHTMYETLKTRTFLRSSFTRGFILFARDMQKDKCVGRYGVQEKTARFIASTEGRSLRMYHLRRNDLGE